MRVCVRTRVNDLLLFAERHPGGSLPPLGSLNFQVSLLDGQCGDAFVMSRVELGQVLSETQSDEWMRNHTDVYTCTVTYFIDEISII